MATRKKTGNHLTKAQEARGGRHANMVLDRERGAKAPPLSESYVGAVHHSTGKRKEPARVAKAHEAAGGRKANKKLAAERRG